jgi:tetratricopeptide (TPR) repeat protein
MSNANIMDTATHFRERGALYFHRCRYREALKDFKMAIELCQPHSSAKSIYMVDLGNACQMTRQYDSAEYWYLQTLADPRAHSSALAVAQTELKKLNTRRSQGIVDLRADDERLEKFGRELLVAYPLLRRPMNLWWVNPDEDSMARIETMESRFDVESHARIRTTNWAALSHFPKSQEHFVLVRRDYWEGAADEAVRGVMAHEFTHEEWKETGVWALIPSPASSAHALLCNERACDLITIAKGFGEDLLTSRLYQEEHDGTFHHSVIMSPKDIEALLHSSSMLVQNAEWQTEFAVELTNRIGLCPVAKEELQKARHLWQQVVELERNYAHGFRELGTVSLWLEDATTAVESYRRAVELKPDDFSHRRVLEEAQARLQ